MLYQVTEYKMFIRYSSAKMLCYTPRWKRILISCVKLGTLVLCTWVLSMSLLLSMDDAPVGKPEDEVFHHLREPLHQTKSSPTIQDGGLHEDVVHVCFTSDRNTIIGAMAAINSVIQNTHHKVKFHVIVESDIVDHVKQWLSGSVLREVDAEVIGFHVALLQGKIKVRGGRTELAKPMNYARFLYPTLLPDVRGRLVHLDDDVIVQGDIAKLANINFKPTQITAFAEDCISVSKRLSLFENNYANFLNFKNEHIKELHMDPGACSFNTGVFVTDLGAWGPKNISDRLLHWTELNTREDIYGNQKGGGGSQPPMMIVFYKQYVSMNPMWHIRRLGSSSEGKRYSTQFIRKGKLLHWNGPHKPWGVMSPYQHVWDRYYVPDPSGTYQPVRRKRKWVVDQQ